jgi:hypothetical protein
MQISDGCLATVELGMAAINEEGYGGPVGDMGSTNNVDTLKNIWFDDTEAWEGIDEVRALALGAVCRMRPACVGLVQPTNRGTCG